MSEPTQSRPDIEAVSRLSWWRILLLYPVLITSLGGAIPTVWQAYKAWRLEVSYNKVQVVEAQKKLWERNLTCLTVRPVYTLELDEGVTLNATICETGDVLLHYSRGLASTYTWVAYPSEITPGPPNSGLVAPGIAWADSLDLGPPAPTPPKEPDASRPMRLVFDNTKCVRLKNGLIIRLSQEQEGQCLLYHISLESGRTISRVVVPCSTPCSVLQ